MKQIIIKLLPIIIVFLLVVYSHEFVELSHTILGKFMAVSIIVFYIKCDILYGLLACLLVIFYYQSDFAEQYDNVRVINLEGFQEGAKSKKNKNKKKLSSQPSSSTDTESPEEIEKQANAEQAVAEAEEAKANAEKAAAEAEEANSNAEKAKTDAEVAEIEKEKAQITLNTTDNEQFSNYNELYPDLAVAHMQNDHKINDVKSYFKKQYCKKGQLTYKNILVKNEMVTHIFPEVNFENGPCNPCLDTCKYSIIEEKMKTEDELVKPKNSNDFAAYVLSLLFPVQTNTAPAIGLVSEPFSQYK
jgi:hypothetical protein